MTHYLLSVHSVEGEVRQPMTDEEVQQSWKQVHALEEEMKGTVALSRETPAKPSEVEAHLTRRPPRRTRTTRSWLWSAKFERRSGGSQTG
jgi:hypothetical protein